jgi:hypothetical protein
VIVPVVDRYKRLQHVLEDKWICSV